MWFIQTNKKYVQDQVLANFPIDVVVHEALHTSHRFKKPHKKKYRSTNLLYFEMVD